LFERECWRCILTPSRDLAYIEAAAPHQSYPCATPPSKKYSEMERERADMKKALLGIPLNVTVDMNVLPVALDLAICV